MRLDEFMKNIAPHMKPGYIAMDKSRMWYYYNDKPLLGGSSWLCSALGIWYAELNMFNIDTNINFKESLRKVGNV